MHRRNNDRCSRVRSLVAAGVVTFLSTSFLLAAGGIGRPARADGAFPDGQAVLLPRDRPNEIILGTNFGLVFTEDGGQSWTYACETNAATMGGYRYVVGPPSSSAGISGDRLFGISSPPPGAPVSTDDGCTWTLGGGVIADPNNIAYATDVFPDPSDPARVFLLGTPTTPDGAPGSVYRSLDGGLTYAGPLFTPSAAGQPTATGVEVSASSPGTVYVTWYERQGDHPHLARSTNDGDTWTDIPIEASLGPSKPYLAGVDPTDPEVVFLRTISADGAAEQSETLAVTRDGGATWTVPITIPGGTLQGFVRRQDGSFVALGKPRAADGGAVPPSILFRSSDGGRSFAAEPLALHGRGLAARDGVLFLATDNVVDLVALVSSVDDGHTWTPRLRFQDIAAIKACVFASCRDACAVLLGNAPIFAPEVCGRAPIADGGATGGAKAGAGGGGGSGGSGGAGGGKSGGCAFAAAQDSSDTFCGVAGVAALAALAALAFASRALRRGRGRRPTQT